jgi:hypothetical protein
MSLVYTCDREGCDVWVRDDADTQTFVVLYSVDDYDTPIAYCCSIDCLMHWAAANSVPTDARKT